MTTTANASLISQRAMSEGVTPCLDGVCRYRLYVWIIQKQVKLTPIQHLFNPKSGSHRPVHRLDCSVPVTHNSSQRLQAKLGNLQSFSFNAPVGVNLELWKLKQTQRPR